MNVKEFRVALVRADLSQNELADRIGMSRQSLSFKTNGKREFKLSEIKKISDVLGLSSEDVDVIFFGKEVN